MSSANRARLGRGLGALLGEEYLTSAGASTEAKTLPVRSIGPNPFQPRREFGAQELTDLAVSIRENGLLQPILVRPSPSLEGERYELVAGERRLRAVSQLGWEEIPVVIRSVDDQMLLVLALVENLQREALNPVEEAEGLRRLTQGFGLTQEQVAEAVGKDRSTVANTLRLLKLPLSVRRLLEAGALSMGHARALLAVKDPGRLAELGKRAAREGWSVREVEHRSRAEASRGQGPHKSTNTRSIHDSVADPTIHALQEALRETLGSKVRLKSDRSGRGVVEIPFRSGEDLERVFEILTGRNAGEITG